jgi:hypothetical protein
MNGHIRRRTVSRWRDILPVHPAAELFPLMSGDELSKLAADIEKHGLREKIDLYWDRDKKPFLVDGRNRLDALELLGQELFDDSDKLLARFRSCPPPSLFSEADCIAFAISKNIHRRHLTSSQKRGLIAKLLKARPEASNIRIAKQVRADDKTVAKVRGELERRSDIPTVAKRSDTKGRKQPAHQKRATEKTPGALALIESPPLIDMGAKPAKLRKTDQADLKALAESWKAVEAQLAPGDCFQLKQLKPALALHSLRLTKICARLGIPHHWKG